MYQVGDLYVGRYRVRNADGKWSRKAIPIGRRKEMTKPQAERKLRLMLDEIGVNKDATIIGAINPMKTFREKAAEWERTDLITYKPSSENMPGMVKKHLIPFFGDMPVDQITTDVIKEWRAKLMDEGKLKVKTISNVYKVLRLVVGPERASGWHLKFKVPRKEQRYLRPEEVKRIIDEAKGQYKLIFELDFNAGFRFGELAGLHVEDLDFEHSMIHIRRTAYKNQMTEPKTDAGYRNVPITRNLMAKLKKHVGDRQSGLVFSSKRGTPLRHSEVNRSVLKPICKKLGIAKVTTHAFRHGRVSYLQKNRVPGDMIKSWIGHSSLKITSGYTHFSPEDEREVIDSLG